MLVLAVLFLAVAVVVTAFVIVSATGPHAQTTMEAFGLHVTTSTLLVFLAGAVVLLLAELGVGLLTQGARRNIARRRELRRLRRLEAKDQHEHVPPPEPARDAAAPRERPAPDGEPRGEPHSTA